MHVMGFLTVLELVCSCLSIAGATILVAATFASKKAYDSDNTGCSSKCPLYSKFTFKDGVSIECGKKGVCDTALFAGFAALATAVLFVVQLILVFIHERRSGQDGKLSR